MTTNEIKLSSNAVAAALRALADQLDNEEIELTGYNKQSWETLHRLSIQMEFRI